MSISLELHEAALLAVIASEPTRYVPPQTAERLRLEGLICALPPHFRTWCVTRTGAVVVDGWFQDMRSLLWAEGQRLNREFRRTQRLCEPSGNPDKEAAMGPDGPAARYRRAWEKRQETRSSSWRDSRVAGNHLDVVTPDDVRTHLDVVTPDELGQLPLWGPREG